MTGRDNHPGIAATRAEVIKILTLPWPMCTLGLAGLTALVPALLADLRISTSGAETVARLPSSFGLSLCVILFTVFGCLVAGSDLRSGELNLGLLAVPLRARLFTAKLSAMLLLTACAAVLTFTLDRFVRQLVSSGAEVTGVATWQTGTGYVISCVMFAVLGLTLTVLLRSTMIAVATLTLAPILAVPLLQRIAPLVDAALPFSASGLTVTGDSQISAPWGAGVGVVLAWLVAASSVFALLLQRRDA